MDREAKIARLRFELREEQRRRRDILLKQRVKSETRYTWADLKPNKIVGISVPFFKKVQWGVISNKGGIEFQKPLYYTYQYEEMKEPKKAPYFHANIGNVVYNWWEIYEALGEETVPLNCIVSVDYSKANVREEYQKMSKMDLLGLLQLSYGSRRYWDEDDFFFEKIDSVQKIIEIKAQLLKYGRGKS